MDKYQQEELVDRLCVAALNGFLVALCLFGVGGSYHQAPDYFGPWIFLSLVFIGHGIMWDQLIFGNLKERADP